MKSVSRLASCLVVALVVSGCWVARVEGPAVDDLSTWSAEPLAPDAGLEATAASGDSSCTAGPDGGPVRILIQDRRTAWTAAFLFAGAASFGSCFVTSAQGASGGGSGPLPAPIASKLSIDDDGSGDVADGRARELGGRIDPSVAAVTIELADGRTVTASVVDGYWLAWWPDGVRATTVTAFDAAGMAIDSVEVSP